MNLKKIKRNKKIILALLLIIIISVVFYLILIQRREVEELIQKQEEIEILTGIKLTPERIRMYVGEEKKFTVTSVPEGLTLEEEEIVWSIEGPEIGILDPAGLFTATSEGTAFIIVAYGEFTYSAPITASSLLVKAKITGINIAEKYLMVNPVWTSIEEEVEIEQEIKIKIKPETIIQKRISSIEETIADIKVGYFVSLKSREDIREKIEINQIEWFKVFVFPDGDTPTEPGLPVNDEQLENEIFGLIGKVVEINPEENYLKIKSFFPRLREEMRVILEPEKKFKRFELKTKIINDIDINNLISFRTVKDIQEQKVIEVTLIRILGDLAYY